MELETLFTTSKWGILEVLSENPSSPLEIAKRLGTTIANVSQQLRLLEASGIVIKTRLPNSEAGKPRALFQLKEDFAYITIITQRLAKKKLIYLNKSKLFVSRAILLENKLFEILTKWFFENEKILSTIDNLYLKSFKSNKVLLESSSKINQKFTAEINNLSFTIILQNSVNPGGDLLL